MTFLAKPLRLGAFDMVKYILALPKSKMTWSPSGVTLHNSGIPDLATWRKYSDVQRQNWGANYDAYCKTTQGWHSGPHFMGTPEDWSYVLCDPLADGVHASCFNHSHYGVETVGNFAIGADDPTTDAGLFALRSSINILAALCLWQGWDPEKAINFHRECARDGHPCPGARVTDVCTRVLVRARLLELRAPAVSNVKPPPAATPRPPALTLPSWPTNNTDPFFAHATTIYEAWLNLGVSVPFAIAMVTQAEFESGFETSAIGDSGSAFNLYQWHWARGETILAETGIDVRSETDLTKVIAAAYWELNHTEIAAREAIVSAGTAADASREACILFEGAGAPGAADRRALGAERWSVHFATCAPKAA